MFAKFLMQFAASLLAQLVGPFLLAVTFGDSEDRQAIKRDFRELFERITNI